MAPSDGTTVSPPRLDDAGAGQQHTARAPDFSSTVLAELYRYPRKRVDVAAVLWLLTGLLGGHRLYLDRNASALGMALSVGGGGVWWLVDAFRLGHMVRRFNTEQARRQADGLPPSALSFMPVSLHEPLPAEPAWARKRGGRMRLYGDLVVLAGAGIAVGAIASATGNYETIIAVVALSAITLLGARWDALASIPVLNSFDRWSHRLRLFYFFNDPGGPFTLFLRPVVGLASAPFRKRARAEAWLYVQVGLWFTIIFTGVDVLEAISIDASGVGLDPVGFALDAAVTFAALYALAAPIGAILTTHVLLARGDRVVWLLTALTLAAITFGVAVTV